MAFTGHRRERLAEEIQHEVISMLEGELRDPRLAANISVTEVRLSSDLRQARIYVTVEGARAERDAALAALDQAAGFIRHELVERISMHRSPELLFVLDESVERGRRIEELLDQLHTREDSAAVPGSNSPLADAPGRAKAKARPRRTSQAEP